MKNLSGEAELRALSLSIHLRMLEWGFQLSMPLKVVAAVELKPTASGITGVG